MSTKMDVRNLRDAATGEAQPMDPRLQGMRVRGGAQANTADIRIAITINGDPYYTAGLASFNEVESDNGLEGFLFVARTGQL